MSQIYGIHNSSTYKNYVLGYMPSDHRSLHNPYRSISDQMYNAGNAHDNNAPNFKRCVCPAKTQTALALPNGTRAFAADLKKFMSWGIQ